MNTTICDVTNAIFNVFKDAKEKKYNNILLLEDDFIFDEKIKDKKVISSLENFINNQKFDIYYLGCVPIRFSSNINFNYLRHLKLVSSRCIHSSILTKNARNKIIKAYDKNPEFDCTFLELTFPKICNDIYCYYKPLCYQTFPNTEQSQVWLKNSFVKYFIKKNQLDIKPQPGFKNIYLIIYIVNIVIFILIILFIILIFKICYSLK